MVLLERLTRTLLLVLVALLPFEFRGLPGSLSILQLLAIAIMILSLPILVRSWRRLAADRLVVSAVVLAAVFWITAAISPQDTANAFKAAVRVSCGVGLLCVWMCIGRREALHKVWCWTAVVAGAYGVLDYLGLGMPAFFRSGEFYIGEIQRLSGSFEYPNTAAAYYAISLPIVWAVLPGLSLILWLALILTFSRGAMAAVLIGFLAIAIVQRSQKTLKPVAIAAAFLVVMVGIHSFVSIRLLRQPGRNPIDAQYELQFNRLRYRADTMGRLPVLIRNVGGSEWRNVDLSYHWYDTEQRRIVNVEQLRTSLPPVVGPNESISVEAAFRTPPQSGHYLISWDLRKGDQWFSTSAGVGPGVAEATIDPDAEGSQESGDISQWFKVDQRPALDASVSRAMLWTAAWQLFGQHPFAGIGPDNFRLRYGEVLGYPRWDTNVRVNNLYLEVLVGSGVLGIAALGLMLAAIKWNVQPAAVSVLIFLVHGVVDVFLMTTPIYFAFWILLGQLHADRV